MNCHFSPGSMRVYTALITVPLAGLKPVKSKMHWLKVKRNLQKSRKISTLHKWGGRVLCVFTTK